MYEILYIYIYTRYLNASNAYMHTPVYIYIYTYTSFYVYILGVSISSQGFDPLDKAQQKGLAMEGMVH